MSIFGEFMSKEIAISKKDKALAIKASSATEIAIAQRKAAQIELGQAIKKFPPLMNRDGTPVLDKQGNQKYASEKGWTLKINSKTKELCSFSCDEINKAQDVLLSDWILSVRKKVTKMCIDFCSKVEVLFIDDYEKFKKRVDEVIEFSWRSYQAEILEMGKI